MRKLEIAEIAAVVVIRSLWTSSTQARYVVSELQPSPVGHTQVPPESDIIEALTDILSIRQVITLVNKQNMTDDVRHRSLKGKR